MTIAVVGKRSMSPLFGSPRANERKYFIAMEAAPFGAGGFYAALLEAVVEIAER